MLQWLNPQNDYHFLKENYGDNRVNEMTNNTSSVWYPELEYYHMADNPVISLENSLRVFRNTTPAMSGGTETLSPKEIYRGAENVIALTSVNQAEFVCSFNKIKNYPFGTQDCTFRFFI